MFPVIHDSKNRNGNRPLAVNLDALVLSGVQIQKKKSVPAPKGLDFREVAADWWGNM